MKFSPAFSKCTVAEPIRFLDTRAHLGKMDSNSRKNNENHGWTRIHTDPTIGAALATMQTAN